jgi:preprotein translocase subunit YajC
VPQASQQSPAGTTAYDFILQTVFFFLTALFVWYVFVLKPEIDRENKAEKFLSNLKKGDQVITSGGVLGTIVSINQDIATVEISSNVKVRILTSHLNTPIAKPSAQAKK